MNIEQEYTKIINDYDVFACYPQLKKWEMAERLIANWIREHVRYESVICVGTDETDLANIRHLVDQEKAYYQYVLCKNADVQNLSEISWKSIDCALIVSLHGGAEISNYLREQGIRFESIYEYFERNGLVFEDEYYRLSTGNIEGFSDIVAGVIFPGQEGWRNNIIAEFLCQKEKYKSEQDCQKRKLFLERQLVLAIYMKNFVVAQNIIREAEKQQLELEEKYVHAWDQMSRLLDRIKEELRKRKEEDIVVNWIDALGYGDGMDMSYLQSQIKTGVEFTNAFTVTPYTNPTLRTILNEKKDIDDLGYKDSQINRESRLIAYLQKQGYRIKVISGAFKGLDKEIFCRTRQGVYSPCSEVLWDVWKNLLSESKKIFMIAHILTETHVPNWSTKLERGKINDGYRSGRQEVDEQLQFYLSCLNDHAVKIYMSDHGHAQDFHVYLVVNTGNIKPAKVNGMYSLVDFHKLIEQLVEKKNISEDVLTREYVEVQNMDHYNPKVIKDLIRNKKMLERGLFGYRGIVDKQYVYVHYNTGKEWLVRRDEIVYEPHLQSEADDVCDQSLLPYYRRLAGENPPHFYDDPKFRYCKYIYVLYDNFAKQKNPCFDLLNQLVEPYEDNSIAIRLGGPASVETYFWLTEQNRKKIYGIIDNYSKCVCSRIKNMRILSLEEAFKHKEIKAVMLASYKNASMLRKEAEQYPSNIKILDIYDYFEKNGCKMEHHFSDPYMDAAGYDIGFPIDE